MTKRIFRHEQKYLITYPQYPELRPVLAALLQRDKIEGPGVE